MSTIHAQQSHSDQKMRSAAQALAAKGEAPTLLGLQSSRGPEAWFLGPKAENLDLLERLVVDALRDQAFWRRNFHPGDPIHVTEDMKRTPDYLAAVDALTAGHRELLAFLKKSVPFFSMRYQGHMNWETTLPGLVGYFSAMLYNPNNVAFEGSTATTILEMLVGDDLCRMLGYSTSSLDGGAATGSVRPWGHITCDGTVANIEAIWAARNLKFFPLALQAALRESPTLGRARDIQITLPAGGYGVLRKLSPWEAVNLCCDDVLALPTRLATEYQLARDVVSDALEPFTLQTLGIAGFTDRFLGDLSTSPVFLVPGTKHYSFPKAAALLGLGAANMLDVPVDLDARMNTAALTEILQHCQAECRPVIAVVGVMGTTEESAVDPLSEIVGLRVALRQTGLDFHIHADAAWGGYHASMIRDDFELDAPQLRAAPPPIGMSAYVTEQFMALAKADSITVDPHKSGYIPYPAGALCYRNSAMRDLVTFAAPVVFHGDAEPTVGIYGVEGSKPGAAASAVYLSHRVIRPSKSGYGQIIGQAMFTCKMLYLRLLCLDDPRFVVQPLARMPAERDGGDVAAQMQYLRDHVLPADGESWRDDVERQCLLTEFGPDQNILAYACNFRTPTGQLNRDLELANRFNRAIYDLLSINPGEDIYTYDLIVSTTDLSASQYGDEFIEDYKRRLGVAGSPGKLVTVLRSVTMDPWTAETPEGSFVDIIVAEFQRAVGRALEVVSPARVRGF